MKKKVVGLTTSITLILLSGFLVFLAYKKFEESPWTRHGIVKADIIKLAPEVNGKVENVYVSNNQKVNKGDLLFRIDSRSYVLKRDAAKVALRKAYQDIDVLKANVEIAKSRLKSAKAIVTDARKDKQRNNALFTKNVISQESLDNSVMKFDTAMSSLNAAKASLLEAKVRLGEKGKNNIMVQSALIQLEQAELNLSYTEVRSPVDGKVVNVEVHSGDYVVTGKPVLAVVDKKSIHVMAAFKETQLQSIEVGDKANIVLMSMNQTPLKGKITSIGSAINPREYSSSNQMIPSIPAAFDWVRLAQRVPVELTFDDPDLHPGIIPGTTASVSIVQSSGI